MVRPPVLLLTSEPSCSWTLGHEWFREFIAEAIRRERHTPSDRRFRHEVARRNSRSTGYPFDLVRVCRQPTRLEPAITTLRLGTPESRLWASRYPLPRRRATEGVGASREAFCVVATGKSPDRPRVDDGPRAFRVARSRYDTLPSQSSQGPNPFQTLRPRNLPSRLLERARR